jgi:uncharacterized protein YndB with AHSA1/START domain
MTTLMHEILIEAPVEAVWAALADLEAVQHYNPMVASARCVSDRREGVGATRRCEFRPGGSAAERVTEWSPGRAMAMEAFEHPWPMQSVRWRNELVAEGGATRLTQELHYQPTGDPEMAAAMASQWDQGIRAVFAGLKTYLEAQR